jgi:tripartite-type tricarboxylate transporter receptor subunit TctC
VADLLAGQIQVALVTTATRSQALPDIPTLGETIAGFEASQWVGLVAPRDAPSTIIGKLNLAINAALDDAGMKARFADLVGMVLPGSPAHFSELIRDETEKWGNVIRAAKIKLE